MVKITTPITSMGSTAQYTPGTTTIVRDTFFDYENEYIYLAGVASTAAYDWASFSSGTGKTLRLAANVVAPIGIAQAACTAGSFGWYGIKGIFWGNSANAVSSGTGLYACGTAGTVSDSTVAGDYIVGASPTDTGASGGTVRVYISYPYITNTIN